MDSRKTFEWAIVYARDGMINDGGGSSDENATVDGEGPGEQDAHLIKPDNC